MRIHKIAVLSPSRVKELGIDKKLPESPEFQEAVSGTPAAKLTDDGLEISLYRRQHPNQFGSESPRSGVFYLPEGDKNKRQYTGRGGYGGSEEVRGTTVIRNPLFVKGSTGGKAPEMAYDTLKGSGKFNEMYEDARNIFLRHTWQRDPGQTIKAIQNFLHKYGGEYHMADHMYSTAEFLKGNHLITFMLENVVANVVREAGYDSVVGWSRRRDGTKFISEVFDLREATYPVGNFGGRIHTYWLERVESKVRLEKEPEQNVQQPVDAV